MVSFGTQRDKQTHESNCFVSFYRKLVRVSHGHRVDLPEEARPQDCKQLVSSPVEHILLLDRVSYFANLIYCWFGTETWERARHQLSYLKWTPCPSWHHQPQAKARDIRPDPRWRLRKYLHL